MLNYDPKYGRRPLKRSNGCNRVMLTVRGTTYLVACKENTGIFQKLGTKQVTKSMIFFVKSKDSSRWDTWSHYFISVTASRQNQKTYVYQFPSLPCSPH